MLRPYNTATGEGGLYYYDFDMATQSGPGIHPIDVKPAVPIIVAADPPFDPPTAATWDPANRARYPLGIGVNISEPTPMTVYYREPKVDFPATAARFDPISRSQYEDPPSYYSDLAISEKSLPDVPFDRFDAGPAYPLAELPNATMTGTHAKFRVALLQRLADPTRSWDATTNPYLTVDSQSIDLTVFNGEEDSAAHHQPAGTMRPRIPPPATRTTSTTTRTMA